MGRLTVEQIVSVDGYAADAEGGIGFFEAVDEVDSNDADQLAFLEHVDAIVLGANTYRMFAAYWPYADPEVERVAEPINRLPKFVVSNTLETAPWGEGQVEVLRGDGVESVAALKERYDRHHRVGQSHPGRCTPRGRTRRRAAASSRARARSGPAGRSLRRTWASGDSSSTTSFPTRRGTSRSPTECADAESPSSVAAAQPAATSPTHARQRTRPIARVAVMRSRSTIAANAMVTAG